MCMSAGGKVNKWLSKYCIIKVVSLESMLAISRTLQLAIALQSSAIVVMCRLSVCRLWCECIVTKTAEARITWFSLKISTMAKFLAWWVSLTRKLEGILVIGAQSRAGDCFLTLQLYISETYRRGSLPSSVVHASKLKRYYFSYGMEISVVVSFVLS